MTETNQVMEKLATAIDALAESRKPSSYEHKPTGKLRYTSKPKFKTELFVERKGLFGKKNRYVTVSDGYDKILEQEWQSFKDGVADGAPYWEKVTTRNDSFN